MRTEHLLFLVLGITPKSRAKFARSGVCPQADRSKAMVLV